MEAFGPGLSDLFNRLRHRVLGLVSAGLGQCWRQCRERPSVSR